MDATSTAPGSMEHTIILKKLNEIKTAIDDGFSKLATKINDIGLKQKGGRTRRRVKNKKLK